MRQYQSQYAVVVDDGILETFIGPFGSIEEATPRVVDVQLDAARRNLTAQSRVVELIPIDTPTSEIVEILRGRREAELLRLRQASGDVPVQREEGIK